MDLKSSEIDDLKQSIYDYNIIKIIVSNFIFYIKQYGTVSLDFLKKFDDIQKLYTTKNAKLAEISSTCPFSSKFLSDVIKISDLFQKINEIYINNIKNVIDYISKSLIEFDKFLTEKDILKLRFEKIAEESMIDFQSKLNNVKDRKLSFITNMSRTEESIYKYQNFMKQINLNNNEEIYQKDLIDNSILLEEQMNELLKATKNIEKEYDLEIETAKSFEDTFLLLTTSSCDNIKTIINEIINKFKENIVDYLNYSERIFITFSNNLNENTKVINDINFDYNDSYINNKNKNNYKKIKAYNYNLKMFNKNNEIDKNIIKLNDDINKIIFFNNDIDFIVYKKMTENFKFIKKNGIDIKTEENKITTKKLTNKFLYNNNDKNISDEEIKLLQILLDKHENRVVFLYLLNEYRGLGNFELEIKVYQLIVKLFLKIINAAEKDDDLFSLKNIVILSQTFYTLRKDKNKEYIQNNIKQHKLFKDQVFWRKFLDYSIGNKKNENEINTIFGEIVFFTKNMIDFGLDGKIVNDIIEPFLKKYNLCGSEEKAIKDIIKTNGLKNK